MRMRSLLAGLCLVLGISGCAPAKADGDKGQLTLAQFQDRVVAEVERRNPSAVVKRVGENELRVQTPGQEEGVLYLERAYAIYQAAPEELATMIPRMVSKLEPVEITADDQLVVLVRPATFSGDGSRAASGDTAFARPLAGGLVALVAIDRPDNYVFPPSSELRDGTKLDDKAIWDRALQNTLGHLHVAREPVLPGKPVEITTGEGFAASLLAVEEFWNAPELTANGPLVVAVLGRDELYVAPLSDAKSVQAMRKAMALIRDDPNGLTNELLVRRDGRWDVWP